MEAATKHRARERERVEYLQQNEVKRARSQKCEEWNLWQMQSGAKNEFWTLTDFNCMMTKDLKNSFHIRNKFDKLRTLIK